MQKARCLDLWPVHRAFANIKSIFICSAQHIWCDEKDVRCACMLCAFKSKLYV